MAEIFGTENGETLDGTSGADVIRGAGGNDVLNGHAGNDQLYGDPGDDMLDGGDGDDILIGGRGYDTMTGGLGNDSYFVDATSDTIVEAAGQGTDRVYSQRGYTLRSGASIEILSTTDPFGTGSTSLTGNEFANIIYGNAGNNFLRGEGNNDTLNGYDGDDRLDGGSGADIMAGALGDDTFYVDHALDVAWEIAGQGSDRVYTSVSYTLTAGSSIDVLSPTSPWGTAAINLRGNELANTVYANVGNNILYGEAGDDALYGYAGNDILIGGSGVDLMRGDGGDDKFVVDNAADVVIEIAGGGTDRVYAEASYALAAGASIEILSTIDPFRTATIALAGNEFDNIIYGNHGNNTISGGQGNDILYGYNGADAFRFDSALGSGNVDTIGDFMTASDGIELDESVFAGLSRGTLSAGAFNIGAAATEADDRVIYDSATGALLFDADGSGAGAAIHFATITAGLAMTNAEFVVIAATAGGPTENGDTLEGTKGPDEMSGAGGDDILYGRDGNDRLDGGNGNDILVGGAGVDTMIGGLGDDSYYIDSYDPEIVIEAAGQGTDRVFTSVWYTLQRGVSVEFLSTTDPFGTELLNLHGNEFGNRIFGNMGRNNLTGGGGNDWLYGYDGNDYLDGGSGTDAMTGGRGNDDYSVEETSDIVWEVAGEGTDSVVAGANYTLPAGSSVEILRARNPLDSDLPINLRGNELANAIYGNSYDNVLNGGGGNDTMSGYQGDDVFRFDTALGSGNVDTIGDFDGRDDMVQLDDAVFVGLAVGALAAGAFNTGAAATEADDRIIYDSATGALLFDVDGVGGAAAVQFATLSGGPSLTASEFLVI